MNCLKALSIVSLEKYDEMVAKYLGMKGAVLITKLSLSYY